MILTSTQSGAGESIKRGVTQMNTASILLLNLRNLVRHIGGNDEGADMAEYALVLVLIAVVAIAAVTTVGTQVTAAFCGVVGGLGGAC